MKSTLLSFCLTTMAQAAIVLDPSQVLQFPVAREGLTRISIENDGIEDIYAYPTSMAANVQHHKSGHVFVVADDVKGPMFLTLITKRGIAQDLKLIPSRKTTEPILLRFETEETKAKDNQNEVTALLKRFMTGSVPQGFYPISLDDEPKRTAGALTAELSQAFQDAHHRVLIFDVRSDNSSHQVLETSTLWIEGDLAISFDAPSLEAGQTAKLYVIQQF